MPNGVDDLSIIFAPIGAGPMYATPTGFIDPNTGKDLREIFAVNTTRTILDDTKLLLQNGIDLRYIFQGIQLVSIGGTGTYTENITGNKYTYTFTIGTNTISINQNISSFNAIVVGAGGNGSNSINSLGGGGGGGGFGYISFSYVANTIYNISVGAIGGSKADGGSSFFTNSSGIGVTSTGGKRNANFGRPQSGVCTNNGIVDTFVSRTGGTGGTIGDPNGENSSGSITVLGVTYNYSGGGRAGTGTFSNANNKGGNAGLNGVGGTGTTATINGETASTPGSGGGGTGYSTGATAGFGGRGEVIVTFTYP